MERRLAAVLVADVVGYSRQMGEDDEGTLRRLEEILAEVVAPTVASHRGRIIKTMGDGILAEFSSVVDAVRAAVALQGEITSHNARRPSQPNLDYRIGISLGDVIAQGDDIFGEGVNVAARLEAVAGAGEILVSEAVAQQVGTRSGIDFVRLGPRQLKNIAAPVTVFRVGRAARASRAGMRQMRRLAAMALLLLAAVAVTVAGMRLWPLEPAATAPAPTVATAPPAVAPRPGIAILPIANLSGDAAQDYIAEGLTEDVIAALGRFPAIAVSSRTAVEPFRNVAAVEAARALDARYLVEGSLRRAGTRVRVQAQLLDQSGRVLWSDRFEEDSRDLFALQDALVTQLASALGSRIARFEQARSVAKPTGNLDAYDLVLRARHRLSEATRVSHAEARALVVRAIEIDPGYADAHALLARIHYDYQQKGFVEDPIETAQSAETEARLAISLDPGSARGHSILSRLLVLFGRYDDALVAADRALDLNPSDAEAQFSRGSVLLWLGRPAEAVAALEAVRRSEPAPTAEEVFVLGLALLMDGRPDRARAVVEATIDRFGHISFQHVLMAMAFAALGREAEMAAAAAAVRRTDPFFDGATFGERFRDPADRERVSEWLHRAGLG